MNQILIIIAIVGIGYLLYRSLVIKRQPTDESETQNTRSAPTPASESKPMAKTSEPTASRSAETSSQVEGSPVTTATDESVPVSPQPSAAQSEENQVGKEAVQEAHQAEAKAAEKAYMDRAAEATKSDLEKFTSGGLGSHTAPEVPPEVKTQAAALQETDDALARHRLYQQVIEHCYRGREEDAVRYALIHYAQAHIAEFDEISKPLKKQNGGKLPQVATFKHYAAILTEAGQYDEAIAVCEKALSYDLKDGTKTGYQGRIERIEKLKAKQQG